MRSYVVSDPTCKVCDDTHTMWVATGGRRYRVRCPKCGTPCPKCRRYPESTYCAETPCSCDCHTNKENKHV
jgi:hypothetical protein